MCGSQESCLGAGGSNETSTVLCLEIKRGRRRIQEATRDMEIKKERDGFANLQF